MNKFRIFPSKEAAESAIGLNQIVKVQLDGQVICLTRTTKGFFAFESKCPHMTANLSTGKINADNEVVCPWHAYRFNLQSGEEAEQRCKDLGVFETVEEGGVFILMKE